MANNQSGAPQRIGTLPELILVAEWAGQAMAKALSEAVANGTITPAIAIKLADSIISHPEPELADAEPKLALAKIQGALIRVAGEAMRHSG